MAPFQEQEQLKEINGSFPKTRTMRGQNPFQEQEEEERKVALDLPAARLVKKAQYRGLFCFQPERINLILYCTIS